jgi:hypothetical protein
MYPGTVPVAAECLPLSSHVEHWWPLHTPHRPIGIGVRTQISQVRIRWLVARFFSRGIPAFGAKAPPLPFNLENKTLQTGLETAELARHNAEDRLEPLQQRLVSGRDRSRE